MAAPWQLARLPTEGRVSQYRKGSTRVAPTRGSMNTGADQPLGTVVVHADHTRSASGTVDSGSLQHVDAADGGRVVKSAAGRGEAAAGYTAAVGMASGHDGHCGSTAQGRTVRAWVHDVDDDRSSSAYDDTVIVRGDEGDAWARAVGVMGSRVGIPADRGGGCSGEAEARARRSVRVYRAAFALRENRPHALSLHTNRKGAEVRDIKANLPSAA